MSEIKGEILIKGGFIIDPAQKIDGDVGDIAIKDGKIVEKVSNAAKVIDAKGKVVMAGGVDVHSHVAGPKVNVGRLIRPEDKLFKSGVAHAPTRMEMGFSVPSVLKTGYDYARMGYWLCHGSGNAPDPCTPRARRDPRYSDYR